MGRKTEAQHIVTVLSDQFVRKNRIILWQQRPIKVAARKGGQPGYNLGLPFLRVACCNLM